jgi:hypothetical protein
MKLAKTAILLILLLVYAPMALAHTPLKPGEENNSLESAFEIPDPTKSWTLYRELHEAGEAEYFELHLEPGDRLRISLYVPRGEEGFLPSLVVMGPGIGSEDELPEFVEAPEGVGFDLIEPERSEKPEYEPFTPASYYYVADFDLVVPDHETYHFAVYGPRHGRYGVAVGTREEFTLVEWIRIPMDVVSIRLWEGQPLILVFAPMLLTLAIGFGLLLSRSMLPRNPTSIASASAGLLYLGSGFMFLMQVIINLLGSDYGSLVVLSFVFAMLPPLLGFFLLLRSLRDGGEPSARERGTLLLLGLFGFFTWSGFLIGPVLAMLASILPSQGA